MKTNKKRVWAFPAFYPADLPGLRWAGIFAHRQYQGMVANGAELKVVIPAKQAMPYPFSLLSKRWSTEEPRFPFSRQYDGIEIYHPRIPGLLPHALDKRSYKERYYAGIRQFFKKINVTLHPDTDIFFSQWLPESVYVQHAAHMLGVKSAILAIGDDVVVWPRESDNNLAAFSELMHGADMRFACADYLGREVNKILGAELSYKVINWGVEYDFFAPVDQAKKQELRKKHSLPQDKLLILNVGSAIERKGWLDLFDALKEVRKSVDNFAIVGVHAGDTKLDLPEEASKRGLGDIFLNMREVPPASINELYKAADVFCLPSHWEGLANANIEAMASGLPVITTNVCGHPELIADGENGLLIPPKQPKVLTEKLSALLTDDELRKALGAHARKFIVETWGNSEYNGGILYRELCK